jgi:hypothetical protein
MKHYERSGFAEFCVPPGYRGGMIKRFFLDYRRFGSMTLSIRGVGVNPIDEVQDSPTVHPGGVATGCCHSASGKERRADLRDELFVCVRLA